MCKVPTYVALAGGGLEAMVGRGCGSPYTTRLCAYYVV